MKFRFQANKFFFSIIISIICFLVNNSSSLAEVKDSQPIKIGVIIPMTGDWSVWGARIRDSLELFREDHKSDWPIEFLYQDEATCDPQKAVGGYRYLRDKEGCSIFVLGCMNGTRAIVPLARREGVLLLSAGFQQKEVFQEKAFLVNLALQVDSEARALARALVAQGIKRLGIIRNQGVEDFISGMKEEFAGKGVEIVEDAVILTDDRDVATVISRLKQKKVDSVFMNLGESQLAAALKKVHEMHLEVPVFTSYGTDTLVTENSGLMSLAEGVRYSHPARLPSAQQFEAHFRSATNQSPNINSFFVYDGLGMLQEAFAKCRGDNACLFKKMTSGLTDGDYTTQFKILPDGSIERQFELKQILNGKTQIIKPLI